MITEKLTMSRSLSMYTYLIRVYWGESLYNPPPVSTSLLKLFSTAFEANLDGCANRLNCVPNCSNSRAKYNTTISRRPWSLAAALMKAMASVPPSTCACGWLGANLIVTSRLRARTPPGRLDSRNLSNVYTTDGIPRVQIIARIIFWLHCDL